MSKSVGGYVMFRVKDGLMPQTGSMRQYMPKAEEAEKLRQWDKPVFFERFTYTAFGETKEISGPSVHHFSEGKHIHYLGPVYLTLDNVGYASLLANTKFDPSQT